MTNPFRSEPGISMPRRISAEKRRGDETRGLRTIRRDRRPRSGYGGERRFVRRSSWQRHIRALRPFVNCVAWCGRPGTAGVSPAPPSGARLLFQNALSGSLKERARRPRDRHSPRITSSPSWRARACAPQYGVHRRGRDHPPPLPPPSLRRTAKRARGLSRARPVPAGRRQMP
jgi:hypothetical protein